MKALLYTTIFMIGVSAFAEGLTWTVPDGWEDTGEKSSMRIFTLAVKENKALLIKGFAFKGNLGGELANVNRWRGQIGLGPIKEEELAKNLEVIESKAGKAKLVDISNNGTQMLAVLLPYKGFTYSFKIQGKADEVKTQKKTLIEFVKSLK